MSRFRWRFLLLPALVGLGAIVIPLLAGCGGGSDQVIFLTVRDRPGWGLTGRIAVSALGGDGNLYIWSTNENGGGTRLLTSRRTDPEDPAGGTDPCYSPHDGGDQIAFAGRRGESQIIYRMDSARGESAGLTAVTEASIAQAGPGSDWQPSWSPDGATIIYASNRPDGNWDLWTVVVANGNRAELVSDPDPALAGSEERWPVYDPTGSGRVAFESYDKRSRDSDIWLRQADGTLVRLVGDATDTFVDGAPWWSNDGLRIYFHSNRGGDYDIWSVEVATGALTQLTNSADGDGFPVTEPDGDQVAFVRGNEVWRMKTDGSDQKRVTRVYQ